MTARTPARTALVAISSPNPELLTFPCVFTTMTSFCIASEIALCSIRLSPEWHHTVSADPMTRGDAHTGRIAASIAPSRDMQSATCALEAAPKASSKDGSGRGQKERTRNPGLPGILQPFDRRRDPGSRADGPSERYECILQMHQVRQDIGLRKIAHRADPDHPS